MLEPRSDVREETHMSTRISIWCGTDEENGITIHFYYEGAARTDAGIPLYLEIEKGSQTFQLPIPKEIAAKITEVVVGGNAIPVI